MKRWKRWTTGTFALVVGLAVVGFVLLRWAMTHPDVPRYDPNDVERVYYQKQWDSDEREDEWKRQVYYTAPQGTRVVGLAAEGEQPTPLAYSWILHLERPFSRERFADPDHLARFGFLINHGDPSPLSLPVGFARHEDPDWWGSGDGAEVLDVACAACHTGELYYRTSNCGTGPPPRVASRDDKLCGLRVDGGQAMHVIAASSVHRRARSFAQEMVSSMLATYVAPLKWRRFKRAVLAHDGQEHADELRGRFRKALGEFARKSWKDCGAAMLYGGCEYYPTEEGPGRTDALGRIANTLFSHVSLDYLRVADAPVNYPHVWDIWLFDYVQWGHSVRQPMGRNVGETLGVGASVLASASDPFESSAAFVDLYCTEEVLRQLKPPVWPENILPPVDHDEASAGKALYADNCQGCHGVLENKQPPNDKPREWRLRHASVDKIGTDPRSARNFLCRRYDVNETILASLVEPVSSVAAPPEKWGDLCAPIHETEPGCEADAAGHVRCPTAADALSIITAAVQNRGYDDLGLSPEERHDFDGFGLDTEVRGRPVYKARPLEGVWATPPYLHNGSVRTLYQILSPPYERETTFWVGSREYDPGHLGYRNQREPGAFLFDTRLPGNSNAGHLFTGTRGTRRANGVIGPALSHRERLQIIEYLKIHRDLEPEERKAWRSIPKRCRELWKSRCVDDPSAYPYCGSLPSQWYDGYESQR